MKTTPAPGSATEKLRQLTRGRGLRALGSALDCHHTYIGMIITGKRSPSTAMLERMAKVLKTPIGELLVILRQIQRESASRARSLHQKRRKFAASL